MPDSHHWPGKWGSCVRGQGQIPGNPVTAAGLVQCMNLKHCPLFARALRTLLCPVHRTRNPSTPVRRVTAAVGTSNRCGGLMTRSLMGSPVTFVPRERPARRGARCLLGLTTRINPRRMRLQAWMDEAKPGRRTTGRCHHRKSQMRLCGPTSTNIRLMNVAVLRQTPQAAVGSTRTNYGGIHDGCVVRFSTQKDTGVHGPSDQKVSGEWPAHCRPDLVASAYPIGLHRPIQENASTCTPKETLVY
jgi:hypothetical protein